MFAPGLLGMMAVALVAPPDTPAKYEIPYRLTDTKHVLVRAKFNGKGPYNLILDTGAPAVFIPKKIAERIGIKTDKEGWGEFDQFEIEGGLKVPNAKTRVADLFQLEGMNGMGLAGVELHGVIGYNVLAKFRITYDFAADKLTWIPLDFEPPKVVGISKNNSQGSLDLLGPIMKLMAGLLGMVPNFETRPRGFLGMEIEELKDGVLVKSILADGPAARVGLKPGDRIEAVGTVGRLGRVSMTDIDRPRDLAKFLAEVKVGEELKIKRKRGESTETVTVVTGKGL